MLATSADGTRLVTLEPAADRALVRHWDVAAGRHLETRECAPTSAAFADAPEALVRVGTDGSPARTALFVARHLEVPPQPVAGVASLPGGIVVIGSADGTLRGLEFEDPPPAAPSHPVTGEATTAIDAHVGPTVRAMDGLWFHAGIGVGYMQSATERFDASTIGYYHYDEGPTLHGSLTAGGLWKPTEGIALGVGYDLFFDAVVFGVGVTF